VGIPVPDPPPTWAIQRMTVGGTGRGKLARLKGRNGNRKQALRLSMASTMSETRISRITTTHITVSYPALVVNPRFRALFHQLVAHILLDASHSRVDRSSRGYAKRYLLRVVVQGVKAGMYTIHFNVRMQLIVRAGARSW